MPVGHLWLTTSVDCDLAVDLCLPLIFWQLEFLLCWGMVPGALTHSTGSKMFSKDFGAGMWYSTFGVCGCGHQHPCVSFSFALAFKVSAQAQAAKPCFPDRATSYLGPHLALGRSFSMTTASSSLAQYLARFFQLLNIFTLRGSPPCAACLLQRY